MRTIATNLAVMLAVALGAAAFAQTTPKALGWERGQAVPPSAIVKQGASAGPLKYDHAAPVAGLDEVIVVYTDRSGVCSVIGIERFTSNDAYGIKHRSKVDEWAERVATKFGGVAGTNNDENYDTLFDEPEDWLTALKRGNAFYYYSWSDKLPEGYSTVEVVAGADNVRLLFKFDNNDACEAEKEAATQAEL